MKSFCVVSCRLPLGMPRRSRGEFVLTFLVPSAKIGLFLRVAAPSLPQTNRARAGSACASLTQWSVRFLAGAENIEVGRVHGCDQHRNQNKVTQAERDGGDHA